MIVFCVRFTRIYTRSKADKNNVNEAKGTTESDQGATDLPAVSNNLTSHTFPQINQFSIHLFLLVTCDTSSTASKRLNPTYYQRYSSPIHNFNKDEDHCKLQVL
ncbi:hypothetical protein ACFX1W_014249 [Malus domestica]